MAKKYEKCSKCGGENTGSHVSYCLGCYNEYKRARYALNREKEVARVMDYNARNYEKFKEKLREYRQKPEWKEKRKEWESENKTQIKIWDHKKRIKRKNAISDYPPITPDQWIEKVKLFKSCCAYCKKKTKDLEMEHVIPLSKGGPHTIENLVPACKSCNCKKFTTDEVIFRQKRGELI